MRDEMKQQDIALSILKFWYFQELFGQESYPDNVKDRSNKKKDYLKVQMDYSLNILGEEEIFPIDPENGYTCSLYDKIHSYKRADGLEYYSGPEVYVGKIKREACINKLAELLNQKNPGLLKDYGESLEHDYSVIAWFSLKLNADGTYKEGSFSLSPNLWALKAIKKSVVEKINLLDLVNSDNYKTDNGELEKILLATDDEKGNQLKNKVKKYAQSMERPYLVKDEENHIEELNFVEFTIRLMELTHCVYDEYVKPLLKIEYEELVDGRSWIKNILPEEIDCNVYLTYYRKKQDAEKEDNYMPLFKSYYSDDLGMVLKSLEQDKEALLTKDLINYINGAYCEWKSVVEAGGRRTDVSRTDLLKNSENILLDYFKDCLHIKSAPIGKWPCQYSPALMQQTAINNVVKLIADENSEQRVFSVNGPPGTGKTTLLKEVIVHCIISKAVVLSSIADPDDAFDKKNFQEKYSTINSYYDFSKKSAALNKYSIVVTSNNNAAVENITKELPQTEKLLPDIKDLGVKELFTPENGRDIYFSDLSEMLFRNGRADDKLGREAATWGLVAVALGKKSNIDTFHKNVLVNLLKMYKDDVSQKNYDESKDGSKAIEVEGKLDCAAVEKTVKTYSEVREEFLKQLSLVEKSENSYATIIDDYCSLKKSVDQKGWSSLFEGIVKRFGHSNASETLQSLAEEYLENTTKVNLDFVKAVLHDECDSKDTYKGPQLNNPWFESEYDRNREKLLYYALQLIESFILSSKACRTNLELLEYFWDGKYRGSELKLCEADRAACAVPVMQTLLLLVPVISSTFASVQKFFRECSKRDVFGLLVVDEAGQAPPQMALGSLFRARRAIIVGDPKQVEPVVTGELDVLTRMFDAEIYAPYKDKSISVQRCADIINGVGTYLKNTDGGEDWVGCPLVVHRRCLSPMFDIANKISYDGIMKKGTFTPSEEQRKLFLYEDSKWFDIQGKEKGNKDHFVEAQGAFVADLVQKAFDKCGGKVPSLYVISPFKSVAMGMKQYLERRYGKDIAKAMDKNIGTVHTFQGKEAQEVIFLLGCDSSDGAKGAVGWVNNNIVNVAATRAKSRLYVVGRFKDVWEKQGEGKPVYTMYKILEQNGSVVSIKNEVPQAIEERIVCSECGESVNEAEKKYSERHFKRVLCRACQNAVKEGRTEERIVCSECGEAVNKAEKKYSERHFKKVLCRTCQNTVKEGRTEERIICSECGGAVSEAEEKYSERYFKRVLCRACQKNNVKRK